MAVFSAVHAVHWNIRIQPVPIFCRCVLMSKKAQFMCLVVVSWPGEMFFWIKLLNYLNNLIDPEKREENPITQLKNPLQQDKDQQHWKVFQSPQFSTNFLNHMYIHVTLHLFQRGLYQPGHPVEHLFRYCTVCVPHQCSSLYFLTFFPIPNFHSYIPPFLSWLSRKSVDKKEKMTLFFN